MRNYFLHIILCFFLFSCKNKPVSKPALINQETFISLPDEEFLFKSTHKNWQASLLSFTQPIPLQIIYSGDGFSLSLQNKFGIIEGPAQIVLKSQNQHFFYQVNLQNDTSGVISEKDYRSSKTVNPDSSLLQQRMIHTIDEWRNLISSNQLDNYFQEEIISLSPKTGTFRAQKDKPISSFYIQPGSTVSVNVNAFYNKAEDIFIVTAGPLKDKYNNTVANGTMVAFIYSDDQFTYRMESVLTNGYSTVYIPARKKNYMLKAALNNIVSNTIQLEP